MGLRSAPKLLILGWDAADWQILDPLLARGRMPNLAKLISAGTRADLRTLEPKLSPLLWSSIATGKTADRHGILNFVEPSPGGDGVRVSSSTTRKTKALWNMLTQRGLKVHVVGWYASHPAEPITGTCVSNLLMEQLPASRTTPASLMSGVVHAGAASGSGVVERITSARIAPGDIPREQLKMLLPNIAQASRGDVRPATLGKELSRMLSLHGAALETLRGSDWDCAMVFHDTIDTLGHHFMEYRPPRMQHVKPADLRMYGEVMDRVYCLHDQLLGELLAVAGPDTSVILVSDHGFHSAADRPVIVDVSKEDRAALESRWHRALGVAIFSGPGFRSGERIAPPTLLDIAPTALTALGLPIGADMNGRVISEVFAQSPVVESLASWDIEPGDAGMHPPEMRQDPFEAAGALQQLIDLGYMPDLAKDQRKLLELTRRETQFNLGVVFTSTGRPEAAVPIFRALVSEFPEELRYASLFAHCLHGSGDFAACLQAIDAWQVLAPTLTEPALLRVASMASLGQKADASKLLESVEEAQRTNQNLAHTFAELHALVGQWKQSIEYCLTALKADPALVAAHISKARANIELGDYESAADSCMDATDQIMMLPEAHYLLGVALAWSGELGHAAQSFAVALKFAPEHLESLQFAEALAQQRGDVGESAVFAAQIAALSPRSLRYPTTRNAAAWLQQHERPTR